MTMLLLAVTLQTMKEYAWHSDRLAVLLPDCVMLLFAEVLVDWVSVATRFVSNAVSPDLWTLSLTPVCRGEGFQDAFPYRDGGVDSLYIIM